MESATPGATIDLSSDDAMIAASLAAYCKERGLPIDSAYLDGFAKASANLIGMGCATVERRGMELRRAGMNAFEPITPWIAP